MALAKLQSLADLRSYCLRQLGSPVINIEIDNTQADDRITDALELFLERHFDGVERVAYKYTITYDDKNRGYFILPDNMSAVLGILKSSSSLSAEKFDDIQYQLMVDYNTSKNVMLTDFYIAQQHISLLNNLLSTTHGFNHNGATHRLYPLWAINPVLSANALTFPDDFSQADWVKTNCSVTHNTGNLVDGNLESDTVTSAAAGTFIVSQTINTQAYVRGTYTFAVGLRAGSYVGNVTLRLKDSTGAVIASKVVTPSNLIFTKEFTYGSYGVGASEDIVVEIEGVATAAGETIYLDHAEVFQNDFVIIEGFATPDPDTDVDIYNDRWLKKYATALVKRQWGSNIKKYSGIQLPGGITMNGKEIYDEAVEEIQALEEEFSNSFELPIDMMVG